MKTKNIASILFFVLVLMLPTQLLAQTNELVRVAILETVDKEGNVDYAKELLLRQTLTFAINRTQGYEGYNRVDMKQITGEQNFQRTGMVSDDQIKRVGVMTGAKYILIAEAANYSHTEILVLANLVDIESGKIVNSSIPKVTSVESEALTKSCIDIAKTLLNIGGGMSSTSSTSYSHTSSNSYGSSNYGNSGSMQNQTFTVKGVPFTMIYVEGGSFVMGCTSEQSDCESYERPTHRVMLDSYYIGETEVTQELWRAVMGDNPSNFRGDETKLPVEMVSWEDCQLFITLLNRMTGRKFRLPTEAEWEYAARGGRKSENNKYAGAPSLDYVGWYTNNSGSRTHDVKSKIPNELGIYDMSGNVWEWCQDWYGSGYYANSPQANPTGPSSGSNRVLRGGSWGNYAQHCRVAYRAGNTPSCRNSYCGFRLILVQ